MYFNYGYYKLDAGYFAKCRTMIRKSCSFGKLSNLCIFYFVTLHSTVKSGFNYL